MALTEAVKLPGQVRSQVQLANEVNEVNARGFMFSLLLSLWSLLWRQDRSVVGESRFDREARILGSVLVLIALGVAFAGYWFIR